MAVSSLTQDQGLASVKQESLGRFSMCFPYFGLKHGNGLGSNHASVVPAIRFLQKTLWLNWSLDGFLCSLVAASSSLERYVIWKPHMTYSNLSKQHQYLGALCVCAMSHALLQSGLTRMPFHFQYRLVSTIYLGILSTPGCGTAFGYNGHSMRCWYLDVHPRNGLQEERYWYVEKSSLESSALRTSSSSGLCNGLYGLYLMIIVAPPHKWCVDVYIFTISIIQTSLLDNS